MSNTLDASLNWRICLVLLLTAAVVMMPDLAFATQTGKDTTLAKVMCNVVSWFTGPIGKGIATLAIIVIGVGALMGKVSWGMAIIVGLGVAVIFGAPTILDALGASDSECDASAKGAFSVPTT